MRHFDNMTRWDETNRAVTSEKSHYVESHWSPAKDQDDESKFVRNVRLNKSSLPKLEDQTQALLAELIRQALIRIHSGEAGADSALYRAIYTLQEQNIIENIASTLQ